MSHHCPFPVRSTDSRCGYHASSVPGLSLCLALVAALSCFAGLGHAASLPTTQVNPFGAEAGVTLGSAYQFQVSR